MKSLFCVAAVVLSITSTLFAEEPTAAAVKHLKAFESIEAAAEKASKEDSVKALGLTISRGGDAVKFLKLDKELSKSFVIATTTNGAFGVGYEGKEVLNVYFLSFGEDGWDSAPKKVPATDYFGKGFVYAGPQNGKGAFILMKKE